MLHRRHAAFAMPVLLALSACDAPPAGTCTTGEHGAITCDVNTDRVGEPHHLRKVLWQVPQGEPPADGWPVALLYQGSLFPAQTWWAGTPGELLGGLHGVELTQQLLESGFAVFTPLAVAGGFWCWNTNVPPWAKNWDDSPDKAVLDVLFADMDDGTFDGDGGDEPDDPARPPVDSSRMVAAGISSGGYMTSRMAEAYPGRFEALAIISASWATCLGASCTLPDELPQGHPPTFFGHGALDPVVPVGTMRKYEAMLDDAGVETEELVDPGTMHGWFDGEPEAVVGWFEGR